MTLKDDPLDSPLDDALPRTDVRFRWLPARSLAPRHRPRIARHLLELPPQDRYLRFGHNATDGQINRYVDEIDFERDEVFGVFNRRLELVALAHLAYLSREGGAPVAAEFGVSVLPKVRGRGIGHRLFELSVLHARNRGVSRLIIHALAENTAMLRIVRAAGAVIERDGPDTTAQLPLPPDTVISQVEALVEHQAAEFDYGLKVHSRRLDDFLRALTPPGR
jgi:GNAT superfamily N-acetyltransferase